MAVLGFDAVETLVERQKHLMIPGYLMIKTGLLLPTAGLLPLGETIDVAQPDKTYDVTREVLLYVLSGMSKKDVGVFTVDDLLDEALSGSDLLTEELRTLANASLYLPKLLIHPQIGILIPNSHGHNDMNAFDTDRLEKVAKHFQAHYI